MSNLIPVLSLIVAALAVFFQPLISLYSTRKQIELSRRIASKQIVAPMRQEWINDLRAKVAELLGSALHYWNAGFEERKDDEYKRLEILEQEVILRVNPKEADHTEMLASIREMLGALNAGPSGFDRFVVTHRRTTFLAQKIFKTEWDRIKNDIEKP
jgi:hypothetical protein